MPNCIERLLARSTTPTPREAARRSTALMSVSGENLVAALIAAVERPVLSAEADARRLTETGDDAAIEPNAVGHDNPRQWPSDARSASRDRDDSSSRIIIAPCNSTALVCRALRGRQPLVVAEPDRPHPRGDRCIDGTGKTLRNATVVVQGSKITSIETGSTRRTRPTTSAR